MHIAVAGNIGSGKTTLVNMLSKHYGWKPQCEAGVSNPYLDDYYKDIKRWSFNMEVFFLKERFRNLLEISQSSDTIIQDRSIYEGVYVFMANNFKMGNLDERDYTTYMELFEQMTDVVKYPDLMIYLRSSVPHLVKNIQKRGRDYEQQIPLEYLENLNELYEEFIYKNYGGKVMTIDVNNIDYEHQPRQFGEIIDRIDADLFGLFK
jgi:deoxyadenosine/deoxycytidine kinase